MIVSVNFLHSFLVCQKHQITVLWIFWTELSVYIDILKVNVVQSTSQNRVISPVHLTRCWVEYPDIIWEVWCHFYKFSFFFTGKCLSVRAETLLISWFSGLFTTTRPLWTWRTIDLRILEESSVTLCHGVLIKKVAFRYTNVLQKMDLSVSILA